MPAAFHSDIDKEIFQRPQQQRTKAAAIGIGKLKKVPLHDHNEKILGQVLGIGRGIASAINEGKDRSPIDVAKLGETRVDLARGAALANETPARGNKMSEGPGTFDSGRSSHASSVNGPLTSLKHKIWK